MSFITDKEEIKEGLIIHRRSDVRHRNYYCRVRITDSDNYKSISLKISDPVLARAKALEQEAELRFKVKHEVPVFNRLFNVVAQEYIDFTEERMKAGEITFHRWRVQKSHIKTQLNPYVGNHQITSVTQEKWDRYPHWRKTDKKGRSGGEVSDGTIRDEMATFRSIMKFGAKKKYIRESQLFKGKLPLSHVSREEFTPQEYRHLAGPAGTRAQ